MLSAAMTTAASEMSSKALHGSLNGYETTRFVSSAQLASDSLDVFTAAVGQ